MSDDPQRSDSHPDDDTPQSSADTSKKLPR
jgi:hypothetical protein